MAHFRNQLKRFMHERGFKLIRSNKHYVWSDGKIKVFTAATGSDWRILKNVEGEIRRLRNEWDKK